MRIVVLALCVLSVPCRAAPLPMCGPPIVMAERAHGTAPGLLGAIAMIESGRAEPRTGQRIPWPWTVTAEGTGTFYRSKTEAIEAVQALQSRGVNSIDVGCMQVNLMHHASAFHDLDDAFDPAANTAYAAKFLLALHGRLGSWPAAAAAYHSMTPELGAQYGKLVAAVWSGAPVPVTAALGGLEVVRFPAGGQMRILRDATGARGRILGLLSGR